MLVGPTTERFGPGPARAWAYAGLILGGAGCAFAVAALWFPWAVDGPGAGVARDIDGWEWMLYGDWLLVSAVALVAIALAALLLDPPSRTTTWLAGLFALSLLTASAAGATIVWWLTGWDGFFMTDEFLQEHSQGGGARRAVMGLGIATVGVMAAMRSRRWDRPPVPPTPPGPPGTPPQPELRPRPERLWSRPEGEPPPGWAEPSPPSPPPATR